MTLAALTADLVDLVTSLRIQGRGKDKRIAELEEIARLVERFHSDLACGSIEQLGKSVDCTNLNEAAHRAKALLSTKE